MSESTEPIPESAERVRMPATTPDAAAPHEALFWRRAARWGSTRGPDVWLKYAPPLVGFACAALLKDARRTVRKNLHRLRGPASPLEDARDVLATFATYASCLAETLGNTSAEGPRRPRATILGERWVRRVLAQGRGMVIVTAHTAGWEAIGPLLVKSYGLDVTLVTHAEPNAPAGKLQDEARRRAGVSIAHAGHDPLASLPLLRQLRQGAVVALQLDRIVPGMRTRAVSALGVRTAVPEGPIRLAQLSGAAIVPIFCSRSGHREYVVQAYEPRTIARRANEAEIDAAATYLATCMTEFLRAHPTQWFQFSGATAR